MESDIIASLTSENDALKAENTALRLENKRIKEQYHALLKTKNAQVRVHQFRKPGSS